MMKKLVSFIVLFLCITVLTAPDCHAYSAGIDDRAGIYSSSELSELEKRQEEVAELTGWNIAVITTTTGFGLDGVDACDYAEKYYDDTFGASSSSVVYLIDIDYRWIAMDGDVLNYFNEKRFNTMMDKCENYYMNYEDVKNLNAFYDYLEKYYEQGTVAYDENIGPLGDDFEEAIEYYDKPSSGFSAGAGAVAGLIAAAIAIISVVSGYKFHHAPSANTYLDSNNIDMYRRQDRFVREFTTRTRIDSSSSGGGSGGSRRSGGRSHGGGGRGGRR